MKMASEILIFVFWLSDVNSHDISKSRISLNIIKVEYHSSFQIFAKLQLHLTLEKSHSSSESTGNLNIWSFFFAIFDMLLRFLELLSYPLSYCIKTLLIVYNNHLSFIYNLKGHLILFGKVSISNYQLCLFLVHI